jgi:hypothetical protein
MLFVHSECLKTSVKVLSTAGSVRSVQGKLIQSRSLCMSHDIYRRHRLDSSVH